jgi:trimeric autotransporter adhesin
MERKTGVLSAALALIFLVSTSAAYGQNINTVAGGGPNGLPAASASIGLPWSVVQFSGNTYISDPFSNRVFVVDASNHLSVLAGDIVAGYAFDGGPATAASLKAPKGIAVDSNGLVYIADTSNNVIRVVNTQSSSVSIAGLSIPAGAIATLAGNSNGQSCASFSTPPCGDGNSALSAFLTGPSGVALDGSNNIYIADTGDNVVRVVNTQATPITVAGVTIQSGNIAAVAGTYTPCSSTPCGDGGAANVATLNLPDGVALDAMGNIYVADSSDFAIRVVNTQAAPITIQTVTIGIGKIETIAGNFTQCSVPPCGDTTPATTAQLNFPRSVFVDGSGNVFIADTTDTTGQVVRKVSAGTINTVAGTYTQGFSGDGGSALSAALNTPSGVFVDGSANVFIADSANDLIREVTANNGNINSIVGKIDVVNSVPIPQAAYSGDGSPATNASLQEPTGVAVDAASNWYIADASNNRVRAVNNQTKTITIAGVSIPPGDIATIAGDGTLCTANPCGDGGPATQAQLSAPTDVTLDAAGNIYIVDSEDAAVRVINTQASAITIAGTTIPPGKLVTVAGNGFVGFVDNVPATSAELGFPIGITLDSVGNIYIADGNPLGGPNNDVIRVVNAQTTSIKIAGVTVPPGFIETIAGTPQTPCGAPTSACGDGGPATAAQLNAPTGVAVDRSGNIYVADFNDNRIRKVATNGTISKFAGTGAPCISSSCGDNGPATAALLFTPFDISVDYLGNVFIADSGDFVIRAVNAGTASITLGGVSIPAGDIAPVVGSGRFGFFGDGGPALSAELAEPLGLGSDAAGDLLITDGLTWRVRDVNALLATAPTATPAPGSLTFPAQALNTVSAGKVVTLTNSGNVSPLQISKITTSGDFDETDTCGSPVPAGGDCKITVTFKPTAIGTRTGTLAITDTAGTQNVQLSGTAIASVDFTFDSTPASPSTVTAGGSSTSTITVDPVSGFNGATTLTCSVSPSPSLAPACSLKPSSVTPSGGPAQSTLTITTTAATTAMAAPDAGRRSMRFYAVWLLLPAMLLSTAGLTAPTRKKLIAFCLLSIAVAGLLFLVACGGGNSSPGGGGGGGTAGTPAGTYTVTVTAKSGSLTHQTTVTVTVK